MMKLYVFYKDGENFVTVADNEEKAWDNVKRHLTRRFGEKWERDEFFVTSHVPNVVLAFRAG